MPDTADGESMSLGALFDCVRDKLRVAGVPDAGREARYLIGALLDVSPETFLGRPETRVSGLDCSRAMTGLKQRLAGMPVGRIAGRRDFYGRTFQLGPAILEPRPDSEVLIDAALQVIRTAGWGSSGIRIVDVGTGSGCLLITLLAELPHATGVGVDISSEALAIAVENAEIHGVAARAAFVEGDALDSVDGVFDVLVSNPPYIRTGELAGLDIEVREHDPKLALDGGVDGLDIYRHIGRDIGRAVPNGWMLFEVGAGMARDVCHEIDQFKVNDQPREWQVWHDLHGHVRCVAAKTLNC